MNYFQNTVIVYILRVICQDVRDGFLIVDLGDNVFITCGQTLRGFKCGNKNCSLIQSNGSLMNQDYNYIILCLLIIKLKHHYSNNEWIVLKCAHFFETLWEHDMVLLLFTGQDWQIFQFITTIKGLEKFNNKTSKM